jgi:hypothetical protein
MMFTQKVETVGGIKDFLAPNPAKRKITGSLLAGLGVGALATLLPTTGNPDNYSSNSGYGYASAIRQHNGNGRKLFELATQSSN